MKDQGSDRKRLTFGIILTISKFAWEVGLKLTLSILCLAMVSGFLLYAWQTSLTRDEVMILIVIVVMLAALGLWVAVLAKHSWDERRLWLGIRGQELVLDQTHFLIGNILLEGPGREDLRRQKTAAAKVPYSSVKKFEVLPPQGVGRNSRPAYWKITVGQPEAVFHVRRSFFRGRELEIVTALRGRVPIEVQDEMY